MNDTALHHQLRRFLAGAVLLVLLFAFFSFISTDNDQGYTDGGAYSGAEVMAGDNRAFAPTLDEASDTVPTEVQSELETPREVVTTGSMTVRVKSPVREAETFSAWVKEQDGYVSDLQSDTYEEETEMTETSTVTIRLEAIDEAVAHLKGLPSAKVLSEAVTRRDVTLQAADLDARIDALGLSIARLETFVRDAQNYDDLFRAETELTNRQAQLDSLVAQRKTLSDQVSLQTLTVTFTATDRIAGVTGEAGGSFKDGLVSGWNSLVAFMGNVLYALAVALSWSLVILPIAALLYLTVRVRRARARTSKETDSL